MTKFGRRFSFSHYARSSVVVVVQLVWCAIGAAAGKLFFFFSFKHSGTDVSFDVIRLA